MNRTSRHRQLGLSIVEMMVGIAIGLVIVAAASLMMASQLGDNRRILLETQLQQDLRAAADIIARELRRSSYATDAVDVRWFENWHVEMPLAVESTYGAMTPSSGANLSEISFKYRRRSGDEGPYGFKLDAGELKSVIAGQWQVLTDRRVMEVTSLDIDLANPVVYPLICPKLCLDGTQTCWPELQLRTATVSITGRAAGDVNVVRTLTSQVRLRNDFVKFNGASLCPA